MGERRLDVVTRLRPVLRGFEPYDPAFTPCRVNLSANENTHELPDDVRSAIDAVLLATPLNRYPDPMANALRDAIAERHGVAREMVCVGNGGDEVLFNLLFAFGGPGRTVVTCPPDFAEYANFGAMCECEMCSVQRDPEDYSIDADALVAAARDAALVILTSPNNPTGDLLDRTLVERLLAETDALVLVDEAYVEFGRASWTSWRRAHASWSCARSPRPLPWRACAWATSWRTLPSSTRSGRSDRFTPSTCSRSPLPLRRSTLATPSPP